MKLTKAGLPDKRVKASPVTQVETGAQDLATRIWQGQSPDALSRKERLERVRRALEAKGLSMEGVKL